jgi:hypothetical protein
MRFLKKKTLDDISGKGHKEGDGNAQQMVEFIGAGFDVMLRTLLSNFP